MSGKEEVGILVKKSEGEEKKVSLKGVTIKGPEVQKQGIHMIHTKSGIVAFIDGKAELPEQIADELEKAGYIE